MTLFNNTIRKRVMQIVEQKIQEAQKAHDSEREILLQDFDETLKQMNEKLSSDKEALLEKHLATILGKLL